MKNTVIRTVVLLMTAILCNVSVLEAQQRYSTDSKRAIKLFEEALRYYSAKRSQEAIDILAKAIKADEDFIEAYMVTGDCHADLGQMEEAIENYQRAIDIDPEFFVNTHKQLADAQMSIGKYEDAVVNYRNFIGKPGANPKIKEDASRSLKNAVFGAEAIKTPVPFDPVNLGPSINTDEFEYFPVLTADEQTLVFTRNKRPQGSMDYQEDFYVSKWDGEVWTTARNIGPPINTDDNEGAQTITADGTQLFFTGCNRRGGKGSCDIYFARREGRKWGRPVNLDAPVNTGKWESQPSISADGRKLYFSSNRPGGQGGSDIWVTSLAPNGEWSVPRNLGTTINTEFAEETPFIHPDGRTLYFTSNGHVGMGGRDIFMSRLQENGEWSEPKNLGYPINTWGMEQGLFVDASGDMAYFGSEREGGFGNLDIYGFELYEDARPTRVNYVKGIVTDRKTGEPLRADFELVDLSTSQTVVSSASDRINGSFLVTLPVDNEYALNVSKDGYLFHSEHFSLEKENSATDPYRMDVKLQPIQFGETVILKNIFFETASYDLLPESMVELKRLERFMENNPTIRIEIGGHTDDVGSDEDNLLLSENRAKAVRDHLIDKGVDAERIEHKGYGESSPIDTNDTEEGRAANRRTEFKVLGDE